MCMHFETPRDGCNSIIYIIMITIEADAGSMAESMRACSLLASHPNERWNPRFRHRSNCTVILCFFLTIPFLQIYRVIHVRAHVMEHVFLRKVNDHFTSFQKAIFPVLEKNIMRRQRNAQRCGVARLHALRASQLPFSLNRGRL